MDLYKFAVFNRLRFKSTRGLLTVEQLCQMPRKSESAEGFDLNTVAKTISKEIRDKYQESFVDDLPQDDEKKQLELSLELVKDIIKTKQEAEATASAAAQQRAAKAEMRKKILDAINAKQTQQLTEASIEELNKKLAELD